MIKLLLFVIFTASIFVVSILVLYEYTGVDPIFSRDVISFESKADGTIEYQYFGEKLPGRLEAEEVVSLRTESSYTKFIGVTESGAREYELITFADKVYAEKDGVWFTRARDVTGRNIFATARYFSEPELLIADIAYALNIFAGAGDGTSSSETQLTWAAARDAAVGDFTYNSTGSVGSSVSGGVYFLYRLFFPFDTSAIPSNATVVDAELRLYRVTGTVLDQDNDGLDYVTVVRSSQATHTTVTTSDYNDVGSTEGIDVSEREDLTSIPVGYVSFPLNSTGVGWVAKNGQASNCSATPGITCLALREGHDISNTAPDANTFTQVNFYTSEQTGTSQDPYLVVRYRSTLNRPPNNLGLAGYWSFDEATSTTATDFSGNGRHGALSGDAITWANGKRSSALQFGGSADNVNVGQISALSGQQRITISAWIYDTAGVTSRSIFSRYTSGVPSLLFYVSDAGAGGADDMQFYPDAADGAYTTGNLHQTNRWEHWVVVYDGSQTDADKVTFYFNGTPQAETLTSTPLGAVTDSSTNVFRIGADSDEAANFTGRIDDVRVYTRALSAAEVAGLFGTGGGATRVGNSSKTLQQGTTLGSGLVGHWTFDGGNVRWTSGTAGVAYDSSGNNFTGNFFGSMQRSVAPVLGKLGQALAFDGAPGGNPDGQWVSVSDNAALDITTDITLAAWVKPRALGGVDGIITKNDNLSWSYDLYLNGSNQLGFDVNGTNAGNSSGTIADTNWNHVAATRSGSTITFYINGVSAGTATNGTAFNTNTAPVSIGTVSVESPCGTGCFDGAIDDARIYNRALTAAEIKQLYNLGQVRVRQ